MDRPRPNDLLELSVDDLAFGGQGVARTGGFVIFCSDAAPGDRVRARVRRVRRRFAEASVEEVLEAGPGRVAAPCPYVPRCGGCRLQHLDYGAQLAAKARQVADHLERIAFLDPGLVLDPDPAVEAFGYRNKMEYSAAPGPDGELRLGFHARGRWDEVIDIDPCLLATPLGNALRESVREWAVAEGLPPYDQRAQAGLLRHVVVREGIATAQALVTVVTTPGGDGAVDRLGPALAARHPELVGLVHAVNDGVAEVATGLPSRVAWGRGWLEERIRGVTLRLSPGAFFQTNTRTAEVLYARVAEAAGLSGGEVLFDLFGGVGGIGIPLAGLAREVIGVEIDQRASEDAQANAERNGIAHYRALCGDVGKLLRDRRDELPPADVVIVDPPRAGLQGRAVRRMLEIGAPTLVYVSCNPSTFAADARQLVEGGYQLEWMRPVDMFPQTPHIEAVARLTRAEG